MGESPPIVRVYRGKVVESVHRGSLALVDDEGTVLSSVGNPDFYTFFRSSAKPFQAIPVVESGAADHFEFTSRELAIMAGSHNGTDEHVQIIRNILGKIGLSEEALQCGVHVPFHLGGVSDGENLSPAQNNCSGKHAGMLALCVYRGWDASSYWRMEHPVQRLVIQTLARICRYPCHRIWLAVDGCGVPVHALPLRNMALGFARLARGKDPALRRVAEAMGANPEMVAGQGRICTALIRISRGNILAKSGAEGLYCLGVRDRGWGMALKIEDGNSRARNPAVVEVLRQLGVLEKSQLGELEDFAHPKIKNHRGEVVGEIRAEMRISTRF